MESQTLPVRVRALACCTLLLTAVLARSGASAADRDAPPADRLPRLKVSDNKRFIVTEDGRRSAVNVTAGVGDDDGDAIKPIRMRAVAGGQRARAERHAPGPKAAAADV